MDAGKLEESGSFLSKMALEIVSSPLNIALVGAIGLLVYKLVKKHQEEKRKPPAAPAIPKLKKQDMTLEELKKYDGMGPDGRVLIAANGKIFDVTKGKRFYGPGGPYEAFAGKDASRGLATFSIAAKDGYDDLSDLTPMQMESVREWEQQFMEKYEFVGKLLKPGEEPTVYPDEEEGDAAAKTKND